MKKHLLALALIASSLTHALPSGTFGKSFFAQRPQGMNRPRQMVGQVYWEYECRDGFNGTASAAVEYTRSFNRKRIADYLFFNGTDTMRFAGSNTDPRNKDVDAINFIFPNVNVDFDSTVKASPRVENALIELNFHFNLDQWLCGLYTEIHAPMVWTKWNMKLEEKTTRVYFNVDAFSIIEAWKGDQRFNGPASVFNFLEAAKVDGAQAKGGLANLEIDLGYTIACCDDYHVDASIRFFAPTGNRPEGEYFFEPIYGNGRHVQLGAGLKGHWDFWNDNCSEDGASLWLDGVIYHMFATRQKRTFDYLKNGVGSRYVLLKKFNSIGENIGIFPGPNITTLNCDVKVKAVGEFTAMISSRFHEFEFDFGYNLWGRTGESISLKQEIEANTYGIAGNSTLTNQTTQSNYTINGANAVNDGATTFIKTSDLNVQSAAHPSAWTHKLFAHFGHDFPHPTFAPFIGFGGEIEFSARDNRALDQWGVWIKGGFTYF